jgi:hypothetical protein
MTRRPNKPWTTCVGVSDRVGDEGDDLYARGQLGRGDDKSVCRRRGSRRGLHRLGMRVVVEVAFGAPVLPNQTQLSLSSTPNPVPFLIRLNVGDYEQKRDKGWYDGE